MDASQTDVDERFAANTAIPSRVARRYFLEGQDADDVRQEALLALWQASRTWNPTSAPFAAYATIVIHRQLQTLVQRSQRKKRSGNPLETGLGWTPDFSQSIVEIDAILRAAATLSELEREALFSEDQRKTITNARWRARCKIRQELLSDSAA